MSLIEVTMSATPSLAFRPHSSRILLACLAFAIPGALAVACTPADRNYNATGGAGGSASTSVSGSSSSSSSGGGEGGTTTSSSSSSSSSGVPLNPGDIISTQYFDNNSSLVFCLKVDPNGDTFLAGRFGDVINFGDMPLIDMGNTDIFIARHTRDDKLIFSQSYGSAGFAGVVQGGLTPKGNIFMTGDISDMTSMTFGGSLLKGPGAWHVGLDRFGKQVLYDLMISPQGTAYVAPYAVASTLNESAVYVGYFGEAINIGQTPLTSAGDTDGYIFKTDTLGQIAWAKSVGGSGHDNISALAIDGSGDNYVAGYFTETMMVGGVANPITSVGGSDIFVAKFGPAGAAKWVRQIGGPGQEFIFGTLDVGPGGEVVVASRANEDVLVEGVTLPAGGQSDIFIVKYGTDGTLKWAKRLGDAGDQYIESIVIDSDGNIILTGQFNGSIDFGAGPVMAPPNGGGYLAKLDPNGNQIFARVFSGLTDGLRVAADGKHSILLAGSATNISFELGTSYLPTGGVFLARFAP
jgi:hypothetical protein